MYCVGYYARDKEYYTTVSFSLLIWLNNREWFTVSVHFKFTVHNITFSTNVIKGVIVLKVTEGHFFIVGSSENGLWNNKDLMASRKLSRCNGKLSMC